MNSNTAKNGYMEEEYICNDLNNNIEIFKLYLGINYDIFIKIKGNSKCDIQTIDKNIKGQVKKYKKNQFQQLDRHWISNLIENIPELNDISYMLNNLCEYQLLDNKTHIDKNKPIKKLCDSNYTKEELDKLLDILNCNKRKILNYAFLGNNTEMQPEFLFGSEYINNNRVKIVLFKIKNIIDYLETLNFTISKNKTVIVLGNENILSLQRKGGDGGKKSSNQLQIKIIISKLIDKVENLEYIL